MVSYLDRLSVVQLVIFLISSSIQCYITNYTLLHKWTINHFINLGNQIPLINCNDCFPVVLHCNDCFHVDLNEDDHLLTQPQHLFGSRALFRCAFSLKHDALQMSIISFVFLRVIQEEKVPHKSAWSHLY